MLETIAIVLVILWALGLFAFSIGPIIHLLLVVALVVIAFRIISGRKAVV